MRHDSDEFEITETIDSTLKDYQEGKLSCNFCGKFHDHVAALFLGVNARICNECVERFLCRSNTVNRKTTRKKISKGYKKGEELESNALHVIPRKSIAVRSGQYRITHYTVEGD